jgi:hypothetical protein
MSILRLLSLSLSFFVMTSLCAMPGTPIGGIIVKGGKNPGGQMLVRTTTDSSGKFTLNFIEGGEYQLSIEQPSATGQRKSTFGEKVNAGIALDYLVSTANSSVGRQAPIHKKIENGFVLISVPAGGANVTGTLNSIDAATTSEVSERAINESGVSVKSDPKKGVKK